MDKDRENEILEKIREGSRKAENELVEYYLPRIRIIIVARIRNSEDRQEILNDILLAGLQRIKEGGYDPSKSSSLSAYINSITHNKIAQYLRDYYNEGARQDKINKHLVNNFDDSGNRSDSFEENEAEENRQEFWRKQIENLKPKYKEVLYMRFYKNLSVNEIAELKKVTPQKISDYIKYSKKLLLNNVANKKNINLFSLFFQILILFPNTYIERINERLTRNEL